MADTIFFLFSTVSATNLASKFRNRDRVPLIVLVLVFRESVSPIHIESMHLITDGALSDRILWNWT